MAAAPAPRGGSGLSLCLASAGIVKMLSVAAFTLAWTHSIEKVEWQEDWRLTPQGLELVQARVKGSGAGMEPPGDARLVDGWFQWKPARAPMPELVLGNSGAAGEWRLCSDGKCQTYIHATRIVLHGCINEFLDLSKRYNLIEPPIDFVMPHRDIERLCQLAWAGA